jgi:hypothetical protein
VVARGKDISKDTPLADQVWGEHSEEIDNGVKEAYAAVGAAGQSPGEVYAKKIDEETKSKELRSYIIFQAGVEKNWDKVNDELRNNFEKFAEYYYNTVKKKVVVSSAYRTEEEQQKLIQSWNKEKSANKDHIVYKPASNSLHTKGLAIDISKSSIVDNLDAMLDKYNMHRPVANDVVHITLKKPVGDSKNTESADNKKEAAEEKGYYDGDMYYRRVASSLKLGGEKRVPAQYPTNPFTKKPKGKKTVESKDQIKKEGDETVEVNTPTEITSEIKSPILRRTPLDDLKIQEPFESTLQSKEIAGEVPTPKTSQSTVEKDIDVQNQDVVNQSTVNTNTPGITAVNNEGDNALQKSPDISNDRISVYKYENDNIKKLHTR